jgi:hypothetical protein
MTDHALLAGMTYSEWNFAIHMSGFPRFPRHPLGFLEQAFRLVAT